MGVYRAYFPELPGPCCEDLAVPRQVSAVVSINDLAATESRAPVPLVATYETVWDEVDGVRRAVIEVRIFNLSGEPTDSGFTVAVLFS